MAPERERKEEEGSGQFLLQFIHIEGEGVAVHIEEGKGGVQIETGYYGYGKEKEGR